MQGNARSEMARMIAVIPISMPPFRHYHTPRVAVLVYFSFHRSCFIAAPPRPFCADLMIVTSPFLGISASVCGVKLTGKRIARTRETWGHQRHIKCSSAAHGVIATQRVEPKRDTHTTYRLTESRNAARHLSAACYKHGAAK